MSFGYTAGLGEELSEGWIDVFWGAGQLGAPGKLESSNPSPLLLLEELLLPLVR